MRMHRIKLLEYTKTLLYPFGQTRGRKRPLFLRTVTTVVRASELCALVHTLERKIALRSILLFKRIILCRTVRVHTRPKTPEHFSLGDRGRMRLKHSGNCVKICLHDAILHFALLVLSRFRVVRASIRIEKTHSSTGSPCKQCTGRGGWCF